MKVILILLVVLLVIGGLWFLAMKAKSKGLLEDKDGDFIPDVIEDKIEDVKEKVQDVKNTVNEKVENTKTKVRNAKKALK
jgi:hypothetical protein